VAREIVYPHRHNGVHLIGFPGCYPNDYAQTMMQRLCTHPNVGAVLLLSLGCESFNRNQLAQVIDASERPVKTLGIQATGGTRKTLAEGTAWVEQQLKALANTPTVEMDVSELIVGTICGGSDATSGLTANPAMGRAFDFLVERNAACIFEETGELIGMEHWMAERALTPALGEALKQCVSKAARYYATMGHASFAPGNADGGLSTIEEKSLGAYAKSGQSKIHGIIKPGDIPPRGGLYLLDVVPDGEPRFGFPNINDNAEIAELIACGSHVILFSTGRGSVVGSAISPVIKVCANPKTYARMSDDMDVNAGRMLEGKATLDEVGQEIYDLILRVATGEQTQSEQLGHQEFIMTYKTFEPLGPACLPSVA
jgi:altronate hydrolase